MVCSKLNKYGDINFEDLNSEQSYNKAFAECQSKLANLFFTLELTQFLGDVAVAVNTFTPGMVQTNLGRHVHTPLLAKPLFHLASWAFLKSLLEGAQTGQYLACYPELEGINGTVNCEEEQLLSKATDKEVARQLWEISDVMVGLTK